MLRQAFLAVLSETTHRSSTCVSPCPAASNLRCQPDLRCHSLPSVCAPHSAQRSWSPQSTPHTTTQRFAARTTARAAPRYSHPPPDTTWCRPRHVSLTALAPRKPTLAPPHAPPLTPLLHSSHSPTHLERRRSSVSPCAGRGGARALKTTSPPCPPAQRRPSPPGAGYISASHSFSPAQVPPQLASTSASGTHMPQLAAPN